jgi:hypothetical protein
VRGEFFDTIAEVASIRTGVTQLLATLQTPRLRFVHGWSSFLAMMKCFITISAAAAGAYDVVQDFS